MKLIQITDTHIVPEKRDMHGVNPYQRLSACVDDIRQNHADAELCVITGDLAHKGEIAAYQALSEILARLPMRYHLLVGNHDDRENLLSVFPETPTDSNGFIQSTVDLDAGRLIFIDSVEKGKNLGGFCQRRAGWLTNQLKGSAGRPVYLFMHHPPFDLGIPNMDDMRLLQGADLFADTIAPFTNIRHMFLGHVHRPIAGSWIGIPFSIFRGTAHQVALWMEASPLLVRSHEPPAYGVILLDAHTTVVHFHDYLDTSAFTAPSTSKRSPARPFEKGAT